jgi:hypothetical protein
VLSVGVENCDNTVFFCYLYGLVNKDIIYWQYLLLSSPYHYYRQKVVTFGRILLSVICMDCIKFFSTSFSISSKTSVCAIPFVKLVLKCTDKCLCGDVVQGSLRRGMIKGTNIETGTRYMQLTNCAPLIPIMSKFGRFDVLGGIH